MLLLLLQLLLLLLLLQLLLLGKGSVLRPGLMLLLLLCQAAYGLHPLDLGSGARLRGPRRLLLLCPVLVLRDLDRLLPLVVGVVGDVFDQGVDQSVLQR